MIRTAGTGKSFGPAARAGAAALVLGMLLPMPCSAAEIELVPDRRIESLAPFAAYLVTDGGLDYAAVAGLADDAFAPMNAGFHDSGFAERTVWLSIDVRNATAERGTWLLNLGVRLAADIVVYEQRGASGRVLLTQTGRSTFAQRPVPHRYLVAPLELDAHERARVLIGYRARTTAPPRATIETPATFAQWNAADSIANATFYAAMAFMWLFAAAQAALLRARTQLWYAVFVGAAMIYVAQTDGTALQFLWPSAPEWNAVAVLPLGVAMGFAGLGFTRTFLRTQQELPKLDRALLAAIVLGGVWLLGALLFGEAVLERASVWLAIALGGLCCAAGVTAYAFGRKSARFYVVGAAAVLATAVFVAATRHFTLPLDIGAALGVVKAGAACAALMFAMALADRAREIRLQRDAALQRAIAAVAEEQRTSDRLHAAHRARREALLLAQRRGTELATTRAGVRQSLAELRGALESLGRNPHGHDAEQLAASMDYLERLAAAYADDQGDASAVNDVFSGRALLEDLERMFHDAAGANGIAVRWRGSRAEIRANRTAVLRIMSNLVANAIKYAKAGRILVGFRRRGRSIDLMVLDTGPGMHSDELRRVLDPYERGSAADDRDGTGLGLAIARRLAAELGYEFSARSQPGKGSSFAITLPMA